MIDRKEYARQMRENAVVIDGVIHVSDELWRQIADIIEGEVVTNADHLRALTDEEMAAERVRAKRCNSGSLATSLIWYGDFYGFEYSKEKAVERELEWLRKPYGEETK